MQNISTKTLTHMKQYSIHGVRRNSAEGVSYMSQSQYDDELADAILPRPGCLALIRRMFDSLRPAEKKVASYILDNGGQVVYQSITELASATGTSDATIIRFANALGFSGYQELKIALARELVSPGKNIHDPFRLDSAHTVVCSPAACSVIASDAGQIVEPEYRVAVAKGVPATGICGTHEGKRGDA